MDKKGFTLIELLVVIAIIGVLASTVLASLNTARSKARNARERADVRQIILALELARNANPADQYPFSGGDWNCFKPSGNCWRGAYGPLPAQAIADLAPYLPVLPGTAVNTSGGASCYAYDSYLYHSNHPAAIGPTPPGAYIIWAKESATTFAPGECAGYGDASSAYDCGLQYCYQYLGTN